MTELSIGIQESMSAKKGQNEGRLFQCLKSNGHRRLRDYHSN